MTHRPYLLALLVILTGVPCRAVADGAPTPPMGWNSWDSYGLTVTEAEYRANVSWLHQHLQRLGWQYVVVDEGWYLRQPGQKGAAQGFVMDGDGRYLVADNRFSSATNGAGFKLRGEPWRRTYPSQDLRFTPGTRPTPPICADGIRITTG